MPFQVDEGLTIYEYVPNPEDKEKAWMPWAVETWKPPKRLNFSSLLIPTVDSVRIDYLMTANQKLPRTRACFQSRRALAFAVPLQEVDTDTAASTFWRYNTFRIAPPRGGEFKCRRVWGMGVGYGQFPMLMDFHQKIARIHTKFIK